MTNSLIILVVLVAAIFGGCATSTRSTALGGAIGAGTGAVLGGIADPGKHGEYRTRNVIVGTALGGMAGMMAGSIIHENTEEKMQEAYAAGKRSAPMSGAMPALQKPKVEARWVESQIVGNRYIESHFEYVIIEPTKWEESE
ncbi:MAG: hypothetical protein A2504_13075 [Bdellovibrionales bacterium RIFOXYD12_FULL_39_22]|nr:MAG: hypothetical protein A2385_00875 [Bdellovibrionales bacterium RIFOXYB1_FULL_39_21]OFZ43561.1 MAG: hypothetical protein A2485_12545 [Bdellovibrionales bacterium RIFOXYC12_FULL_39_17]OFZ44580.1 MAG: hypothetical protein A2404_10235 [Bdellovibrionales bacterium RIFOXYC1_FULL_39_130]OFZ76339.1 MAG: hypothetical protein A2560_06855 [Bdellovibrionales bacterium RIFOXYD1_FULL_39_84]OFZ94605.1 MAG: hypothetical protein A2504_13075 [Bdellovibrionales bacterium RIFOXYD12_FULL_39_22]HLE12941.1 hy